MKILCPTDFSKHSITALEYAVNLANELNAEIHILAIYQVPTRSSSFIAVDDIVHKNNEEDMEKLIAGLGPLIKEDNLPITRVVKGDTVNLILKYTEKFEMDLIVMGTQGKNSIKTLLFGSVTNKVAQRSNVPVLAIPRSVAHSLSNNNLLLALDGKNNYNKTNLAIPIKLAELLNIKIDLIHVHENDEEDLEITDELRKTLHDSMGKLYNIVGDDAVLGIKHFVEGQDTSILIMVRREKSFIKKLFTQGNTSAEIAETNIPMLILSE